MTEARLAGARTATQAMSSGPAKRPALWLATATCLLLGAGGTAIYFWRHTPGVRSHEQWIQLTALDAAVQPTLSPDGRMLAFIRGPGTFFGSGEIYTKLLPGGEPVQLTHDRLPKMRPVFSPDGTRIAYTVVDRNFAWDTWIVPCSEANRASGFTMRPASNGRMNAGCSFRRSEASFIWAS